MKKLNKRFVAVFIILIVLCVITCWLSLEFLVKMNSFWSSRGHINIVPDRPAPTSDPSNWIWQAG